LSVSGAASSATAASAESALVRAIGVWGLAAGIVNVTVGGGIFRLPADVAAILGPAAPLAYLVCAVAMGLIVLGFAEAGSRVSLTGGPYAYVEIAFGPFAGFLSGVLLWIIGSMRWPRWVSSSRPTSPSWFPCSSIPRVRRRCWR
jgi:amino acid transporter